MSFFQTAVHHRLRLEDQRPGLDVHVVLRLPGLVRGGLWRWLERAGPRKAGVVAAFCWARRIPHLGPRRAPAPDLAHVARVRRDRRLRPRAGVHLAGLHAHQVVPRPPRHGDGHGDHGLRRRGDDRGAARRPAHEALTRRPRRSGCGRPSSPWGRSTSSPCLRSLRLPGAPGRLDARRAAAPHGENSSRHDHRPARPRGRGVADAAILAALGVCSAST